jgi:hypothetical protein
MVGRDGGGQRRGESCNRRRQSMLVLATGHGSDRLERIVLREHVMVGARATLRELAGLGLTLLDWAWSCSPFVVVVLLL